MTPEAYCQQKSAPIGSAFYYSLRKLPVFQRQAITGVMAFYLEIEDLTLSYDDLAVVHVKLNWWRDEIIKIQEGQPTHPVAIHLQALQPQLSFSLLQLIDIIDGLEQNLTLPVFEKFEDIVIHVMRTAGKREWLISLILGNTSIPSEVIYQLALVIELTRYIQYLRHYVKNGLIYFSQDELQQFCVPNNDFKKYKTSANIQEVLKFQVGKIKVAYQKAKQELTHEQQQILMPILIRCKMSLATLDAIIQENFRVLEQFINLTPIRLWWIAWRTNY